ncbi:hypothetical protein ElyMa_002777500 [Elysia marginata]|uniref:ISXO2-like transposase domain-containing protein n=1 Tax=Elysia marginata TaxID=1093978 RepID=A0AAV4HQC7_9GAST|nr:hypothetical protein ElyMa_002777500 [Elysia marginata]
MRKISSREQSVGQVVSLLLTTDMATCSSCESNYFKIIATFDDDNPCALDYFISHGVISSGSICDWRSFCSGVTEQWFSNQDPIRGVGVEVEVDETLIVRRKYERGRVLNQVWLFGGIEHASKRLFVVPLNGEYGVRRDAAMLIPIIQKFIRPGSIIYSDSWLAYRQLSKLGYGHHAVNHKKHFVKPGEPEVNTQKVERLWRDIKEWVKRPGIRSRYLQQYLARYLFVTAVPEPQQLH